MVNSSRFDWFFRPHLPDEDLPLSAELRFAEALAELPAIERSALALSEIGGLGTNEIAQRLGTDVVVARKVLARARLTVRTTLAARGRRGLTALLPLQNWWSGGSSAPLVRTAGAVAAAVIGTGVAIGGAAADQPRPVLRSPDPPVVRSLDSPQGRFVPATPDASETAPAERLPHSVDAGPAAQRPEDDRYGDIGARLGESAAKPYAPVARGDEPEVGARPDAPPALPPALEEPPPPPPLPFPTPYPVPLPAPAPVPLPPIDLPAAPAVPAAPLPPVPAVPPLP